MPEKYEATFDDQEGSAYIYVRGSIEDPRPVFRTASVSADVSVDYDRDDKIIGIEVILV